MGKVIYYGDRFNKLNESKVQLSKKKYKQWVKLCQWVDNGEHLFKLGKIA